jgi:hypothetical protein
MMPEHVALWLFPEWDLSETVPVNFRRQGSGISSGNGFEMIAHILASALVINSSSNRARSLRESRDWVF